MGSCDAARRVTLDTENDDVTMSTITTLTPCPGLHSGYGSNFRRATLDTTVRTRMLEECLRFALENQLFYLDYQPQFDAANGRMNGVEALIRMGRGTGSVSSPREFIPVAEDCGLICPIGEWALRTACGQNKIWQEEGLRKVNMAVNVSAVQLVHTDICGIVESALSESGLDPSYLVLEITETAIMADLDRAKAALTRLVAIGVQVALDDFGTGYSSLSRLVQLPVDMLKIDHSFVRNVAIDNACSLVVSSIVTLAHSMELRVVAEGVETAVQAEALRKHRCDEMQGYYFSHPLSAKDCGLLLRGENQE
jgi:EAL domain-containing protein (putative c-di-GMP-specific phosphodiesterase class I)